MLVADPGESRSVSPDGKMLGRMHDFLAKEDGVTRLNDVLDKRFKRTEKFKAALAAAAKPVQHIDEALELPRTPDFVRGPKTPVDNVADWTGELFKVPPIGDHDNLSTEQAGAHTLTELDTYVWGDDKDDLSESCPQITRKLFTIPSGDDNSLSTEQADAHGHGGPQSMYTESGPTGSLLDTFDWDGEEEDLSERSPPAPISKISTHASRASYRCRPACKDSINNPFQQYSAAVAESEAGLVEMESTPSRVGPIGSTWRTKLKKRVDNTAPRQEAVKVSSSSSLPFLQTAAGNYAQYERDSSMRTQISFNGPQSNALLFRFNPDPEANPYVKALQAHRVEIQRSFTDLSIIREDSLASRLATRRHDALASMSPEIDAEPPRESFFTQCRPEPCETNEKCHNHCDSEFEVAIQSRQNYPRLYRTPRSSSAGPGEALHSTRSYMSAREMAETAASVKPCSQIDY